LWLGDKSKPDARDTSESCTPCVGCALRRIPDKEDFHYTFLNGTPQIWHAETILSGDQ